MERRKSRRFRIPIEVEIIPSEAAADYIPGKIIDFSPEGFGFSAENFGLLNNRIIKARFMLVPGAHYIYVWGRIVWQIQFGKNSQVGMEIQSIETTVDRESLGYPFDMWKDRIQNI